MINPVLSSTFLLTLLLTVGLFFFIRASVKARLKTAKLLSKETGDALLSQLEQYFTQRAYQIVAIDATQNQVTLSGMVRPSLFLAIFLTLLAAIGMLCLALVLAMVFPQPSESWLGLILLSPLAGAFYWKKSGRQEQVSFKVEPASNPETVSNCLLTITAHRDELTELQRALPFKKLEEEPS
ncbi:MAG: cofactor assembly of complex C subunit B [Cyanothece sp. SIO1E1]|nr:cofactor assembly of complex C subunit B [Cyanothece sp. SIO1E1]